MNTIADVPGILVGHFTNLEAATGCTVVLCEQGAVGGVDVRGAAPGTRETDLLDPSNQVDKVHAVLLSGGSAFGLDAASGVMKYLHERGVGYDAGVARVPIVPGAVIFDLGVGRPDVWPDASSGYSACVAASDRVIQGSVGAGTGATVGKMLGMASCTKGGVGTASVALNDGLVVGALVVVNAVGDVCDPTTGRVIAGVRLSHGFGNSVGLMLGEHPSSGVGPTIGANTTIGVVATNARLSKAQARRMAMMAHDGLALAVRPAHTMYDGDALFTMATGESDAHPDVTLLGVAAAQAVARAIVNAVESAASVAGIPAARDLAK